LDDEKTSEDLKTATEIGRADDSDQSDSPSDHFPRKIPWLTGATCVTCIAGWILFELAKAGEGSGILARLSGITSDDIWSGAHWGLITSVFVHLDLLHLAFNVFWMWDLGRNLERVLGRWRWIGLFLSSAIVSSGFQLGTTGSTGAGASGVVYAFAGFMWITRHRFPIFLGVLSRRTFVILVLWLVGCFIVTELGIWQIGNAAHLSGLVFGVLLGWWVVREEWRRFARVGAGILLLCGVIPAFWAPWLTGDWLNHRALQAYRAEDYRTAIAKYDEILFHQPDHAQSYYNRAIMKHSSGNLEGAKEDYDKAVRFDPTLSIAYLRKGLLLEELDDMVGAIECYDNALLLDREFYDARVLRGRAYSALDEKERALADLDEAISLQPDEVSGRLHRASLFLEAGRFQEALLEYDAIVELQSENSFAYRGRAWVRLEAGDVKGAQEDYARASHLEPENAELVRMMGLVEGLFGDRDLSITLLRQAAALDPDDPYCTLWIAGIGGDTAELEAFAEGTDWIHSVVRFYLRQITEDELLSLALAADTEKERQERLCEAHGFIGLQAEQSGGWEKASQHYEACVATGATHYLEHYWAEVRLKQGPRF
jgi:GlpG protein